MPAPVQGQPGASAIPPNAELQQLIHQSITDAGQAPPIRESAPNSIPAPNPHPALAPQQFQQSAPQTPTPMRSAAPARNAQQDWFAAMGTGDDPDASMDFQQEQPQFAVPQQVVQPQRQPQRQVQGNQQYAIPEMGEIDALLSEIPSMEVQPQQVQPQVQQPQQQQFQQPAPPSAPSMTPEQLTEKAINELMGREYTIPEADARRLISEPETVLPRLAATVHVNAVRDIGRVVQQMLPQMINAGVQAQIGAMRAEMDFFTNYPQLRRPDFRPYVERAISFVRQSNPQATRDVVMREGATLAAHLIKSSYRQQGGQQQPNGRAPVVPFTPVAAGGGLPVPQNPQGHQSGNIFTDMGNDPNLFDF